MGTNQPPSAIGSSTIAQQAFEQAQARYTQYKEEISKMDSGTTAKDDKLRKFMFRECAALKSIGKLQQDLNAYRLRNKTLSDDNLEDEAELGKNTNPAHLHKNLTATGEIKPGRHWQAHHIICSRHETHYDSRYAMFAYGIGINDPVNGVWLPRKNADAKGSTLPKAVGHRYIHTNAYATFIQNKITSAMSEQHLKMVLGAIQRELQNISPAVKALLTAKGKADL